MGGNPQVLVDNNGIGVGCTHVAANGGTGPPVDLSGYATQAWVEDQLAALNTSGGTNLSQIQAQITQLQNQLNALQNTGVIGQAVTNYNGSLNWTSDKIGRAHV